MMKLHGRRFVLAVTGSIAAYKAVYLVRQLIQSGAEVRVLMTPSATHFVNPLTFSVLSKHEVSIDIQEGAVWNNHVELGLWADAMIVAPCTANSIASMACGIADNAVLATYLSARCPVFVAPAMDLDMYQHPATRRNLEIIQQDGVKVIDAEYGELASGLVGEGRMAEPEHILHFIAQTFRSQDGGLRGKNILITAGPTHEAIDPVRYIGNHSTGKMGWALAQAALKAGAKVCLVLGPNHLSISSCTGLEVVRVESAQDMMEACMNRFANMDIAIMAAAVADYRPKTISPHKLKKGKDDLSSIDMVENPDIAATLGRMKRPDQIVVGFALETDDGVDAAKRKLETKNLDIIVLNTMQDEGAGFGFDTNKVTLFYADGHRSDIPRATKDIVAQNIIEQLAELYI